MITGGGTVFLSVAAVGKEVDTTVSGVTTSTSGDSTPLQNVA